MNDIVILGDARTAIGSFGGGLARVAPITLATIVAKAALKRAGIAPTRIGLAGGAESMSRAPYIMLGALTCPFGTGHMGITAKILLHKMTSAVQQEPSKRGILQNKIPKSKLSPAKALLCLIRPTGQRNYVACLAVKSEKA